MPRPRPLEARKQPFRDASLHIIATEDTYVSEQYIRALQEKAIVDQSRVKIVILSTDDGRTSLSGLIARMDDYKTKEQAPRPSISADHFWIVFDIDHHRPGELSPAAAEARQKQYQLAGSNPCFEVWLYLHESDDLSKIKTYSEDSKAARQCEHELRQILGGVYNKRNIDISRITRQSLVSAMERAERLDDGNPWPVSVGTHMHRLLKSLPWTVDIKAST